MRCVFAAGAALLAVVALSGCKSYAEQELDSIRLQVEMKETCEDGGGLLIYDGGTGYRCDFREAQ